MPCFSVFLHALGREGSRPFKTMAMTMFTLATSKTKTVTTAAKTAE
jgi:hypothetical protein